jgi:probable HAF family extracellular repeat protein
VAALLVLVPWHETVRAEPPQYTVENLGDFGGEVPTIMGVNASGQVVGNVTTNGSMPVRYDSGAWHALTGLDTSFAVATGINASGDVVGYRVTEDGVLRAFRYRDGLPLQHIEPLAGGSMSFGFGINDAGEVVGQSDAPGGVFVGFRAAPPMAAVALPTLGGTFAFACGLNGAGQAAGASTNATGAQHAMRVDNGSPMAVDIVPFGNPAGFSQACAIDADGTVGGQAEHLGALHAFRYTVAGSLLDLDTFGSSTSNVESIAAGVSVGWYQLADGSNRAFAHRDGDGSFDLNTRIDVSGWVLGQAKGVNASGVIVGEGTFGGLPAVFRLTPTEPADTTPPVIHSVTANPSSIYPPTGAMTPVSLTVDATDNSGNAPVCTITSVTGGASGDATFTAGTLNGSVRAVGGVDYTFNVSCADAAGNATPGSVVVHVIPDTTPPVISSVSASPSSIFPPNGLMVDVTVTVNATDDTGVAPVCSISSITGGGAGDSSFTAGTLNGSVRAVGGRTYTFNVRCADAANNSATGSVDVMVIPDTTAPVIASVTPSPSSIWPPNGKMVSVSVSVSATDDVDASPACSLVAVTGGGAGDAVVTGRFSASVRANKGTVYSLQVTCSDQAGNTSSATATVTVQK